jgi:hypothetical protein
MNVQECEQQVEINNERTHNNEKKVESSDEIHTGDHLVIVFNQLDYFHFLLVGMLEILEDESSILEIIFYNNEKLSKNIQELIKTITYFNEDEDEKLKEPPVVQRLKIVFGKKSNYEIYKVVYNYVDDCLNVLETIDKATKLVGEQNYNVFENNDEHFAHYCKTGKAGKLLLIDTSEVEAKELFGTGIYDKMKHTIERTGRNVVLFKVAETIATSFPRNIVAANLPLILKKGTPLLSYTLEGLEISNAFYKKYKETKEGKLTNIKFKKFILKRLGKTAVGIAGGIVGGGIGQIWIPVPVVGAMVGGFVGSLIGGFVGYYQGILIGEVVENVDYKIHDLLKNLSIENVNNIDESLLNVEDDCEYVIVNEEDCVNCEIKEEKKKINHEDYDIYLLENSKESPNEDNSINETINLVIKKPKID